MLTKLLADLYIISLLDDEPNISFVHSLSVPHYRKIVLEYSVR